MLRADFADLTKAPGGNLADWILPGNQSKMPVRGESFILRIDDDPGNGFEIWHRLEHAADFEAFVPFELGGHPWVFSTKHMVGEDLGHLPGEAYLGRIRDNGAGWQNVFNLPHIQIIIDETLRQEMPAIISGDLNVHLDHYNNMNKMFWSFGLEDAYVAVHGRDLSGAETIDLCNNPLTQVFKQDSSSPEIYDPAGHGFFHDVATGEVCYERDCPVCDLGDGEGQAAPAAESD
jgi:hypothetical protein